MAFQELVAVEHSLRTKLRKLPSEKAYFYLAVAEGEADRSVVVAVVADDDRCSHCHVHAPREECAPTKLE